MLVLDIKKKKRKKKKGKYCVRRVDAYIVTVVLCCVPGHCITPDGFSASP